MLGLGSDESLSPSADVGDEMMAALLNRIHDSDAERPRTKQGSFLEEAHAGLQGKVVDRTQWNTVTIGDSTYTIERAPLLRARIALDEIKTSGTHEKKESKIDCSLCRGYFERSSVKYRVPNHRIIDLQRSWNVKLEGRRYQSGSFLYSTSCVCVFCAQLFHDVKEMDLQNTNSSYVSLGDDGDPFAKSQTIDTKDSISTSHAFVGGGDTGGMRDTQQQQGKATDNESLVITTVIERRNVAPGMRTYQSSEVDNFDASCAISYDNERDASKFSKTRREVDPWWEMDFGRQINLHSIEFVIRAGTMQRLLVTVLMLKRPIGFEDPFLDSVKAQAITLKEFVVPESTKPVQPLLTWDLPPKSTCTAIRIQLKGINTLALNHFKAYQGDDIVELPNVIDVNMTLDSFATLSPSKIRMGMLEMMSPIKKRQKALGLNNKESNVSIYRKKGDPSPIGGIAPLNRDIQKKYDIVEGWRNKCSPYVEHFSDEELLYMYRVIFIDAVETSKLLPHMTPYNEKYTAIINEQGLRDNALLQHFPRCDLTALYNRIRTILRWIQTKNQTKLLGILAYSPRFEVVADDPDEHLYQLNREIKKIEMYWEKWLAKDTRRRRRDKLPPLDPAKDIRGCSWAEFCMFMYLFCNENCSLIPSTVFGIGDGIDDNSSFTSASIASSGMFNSSLDLKEASHFTASAASSAHAEEMSKKMSLKEKAADPYNNPARYAFSKYKLGNLVRRISSEPTFPKTLTLEFDAFMKSQNSNRIRSGSMISTDGEGGTLDQRDAFGVTGQNESMDSSKMLSTMFSSASAPGTPSRGGYQMNNLLLPPMTSPGGGTRSGMTPNNNTRLHQSPFRDQAEDDPSSVGFYKVCGLCVRRFPRESMEMKVMWKHVLTLRRSWNPKLVPKEVEALDNTITMYNLVHVCVFCAQFFDPDVPDGIAFPNRDTTIKSKGSKISNATVNVSELIPFLDERFPILLPAIGTEKSWRDQAIKSRQMAREAVAVMQMEDSEGGHASEKE